MAFDLHILCVMQERKTRLPPFPSTFTWEVRHRGKNSFPKCYPYPRLDQKEKREYNYWSFMNSCCGFWYDLYPKDESLNYCSCGKICDICSIDKQSNMLTNHCLPDELAEYVGKLDTAIWIKKKYRKDFESVVGYFLSESPVNMIMFLPRWQDEERDIVNGVITRDQFFSMMDNKQIRLNMCYIIRKSGYPVYSSSHNM